MTTEQRIEFERLERLGEFQEQERLRIKWGISIAEFNAMRAKIKVKTK